MSRQQPSDGTDASTSVDVARLAFERGFDQMRHGDFAGAEISYGQAITLDPTRADAFHHLGLLAAKRGDMGRARLCLERAVLLDPANAEARGTLGVVLRHVGKATEAVEAGRAAVTLRPDQATLHHNHGLALLAENATAAAGEAFARAVSLDPGSAESRILYAETLRRQGHFATSLDACEAGLARAPSHPNGRNLRGLLRDRLGQLDAAMEDFAAALRGDPQNAVVLNNIAHVRLKQHRLDDAMAAVEMALARDPGNAAALGNRGTILQRLGRTTEAIETFSQAIDREPDCAQHYANLGALLVAMEQSDAAIAACRIAVRLAPRDSASQFNLAVGLRQKGEIAEAIAAYRTAHALGCVEALVDIGHLRQQMCDWDGLAAEQAEARRTTYRAGKSVAPFSIITATDDPAEQRACAEVYAGAFPHVDQPLAAYRPRASERPDAPLRIGYLSGDFFQHATGSLLVDMLERHDRGRFAIHGYSYGPDDGSPLRRRIFDAFDHSRDLRALSHVDAARAIHADGIDILVDLKGYTLGARTEILCYRPAPIQVAFLGYPATMGARFIDYVVADGFVAPEDGQFSESIVRLPHSYQPNDARRAVAADAGTRAAHGLPEAGFVFCCFNNPYKITPEVFGIWMRLLASLPDAVIWLLETNEVVADNLRREALSRGIDPARLVFASRIPADQHIARMALANLFLDTLPVNAHTTASEALWAGLPVLTCAGDTFIARVAGSLLHAVGLPELVTHSLATYEAMALHLAHDPARLAAMRARLLAGKATSPLFDGASYTRHFEAALLHMAALRDAGHPPDSFSITPSSDISHRPAAPARDAAIIAA